MLLAKLAGVKFTPVDISVNPKTEKGKISKNIYEQGPKQKISDAGPLCISVNRLSDEDVALINKMRALPVYAKVVNSKNGLEISLAKDENDGVHVLPEGYTLKNTDAGTTIISR